MQRINSTTCIIAFIVSSLFAKEVAPFYWMSILSKQPFANPDPATHQALALEAAVCAAQVLPLFEEACPEDTRPRDAVATLVEWVNGRATMMDCRRAAFAAHAAARAANHPAAVAAARAAGQAAAVAHMYTHAPHVAIYAAKAMTLSNKISPRPL